MESLATYVGMKGIAYLDNDELNKLITGDAPVYALDEPGPVSTEQLSKYPRLFETRVGLLEGNHHIILDESIAPVQHTLTPLSHGHE